MEKRYPAYKGYLPAQATLGEPTFLIFPLKARQTVYRIEKQIKTCGLVGQKVDQHSQVQGRSQDFSKGGSQRLLTRLSCRIIAA